VSDVDLEVYRGEFFTMLGPSGSGKTTLLRLIAGFEVPDAGTISLRGVDVTGTRPTRRREHCLPGLRPLFRTSMSPGTWPTVSGFDA